MKPRDPRDSRPLTVSSVGRYQIVGRVGSGGMGVVYRADDTSLRRPVALKFLAPDIACDDEYRARFLREARVAASLNHPNTCVVYEVGQADEAIRIPHDDTVVPAGTPFIAMELIEGDTLSSRLAAGVPLTTPTIIDIAVQLAEGLAEAHTRHIVHRDLKPQNVMITSNGRVKIVDFGLAKPIRSVQSAKAIVSTSDMISADTGWCLVIGTCAYMSPEQAAGKTVDARSDIFAFGIILYEMIAHQLPFDGDTPTEILAKILQAEPAPFPRAAAGLAATFAHVVRRCLQKNPEDRYSDAGQLLHDLQQIEPGAPERRSVASIWWAANQRISRFVSRPMRRSVVTPALFLTLLAAYALVYPINGGHPAVPADEHTPALQDPESQSDSVPEKDGHADPPPDGGAPPAQPDPPSDERRRPSLPEPLPADITAASTTASRASTTDLDASRDTTATQPSADSGTLTVTSTPRASVSLEGNLIGVTPLTVETSAGLHELVLTGPDGLRWRGRVDVKAGDVSSVHRDLTAVGSLSVVSNVWADVSVDGGVPEQTPIHFPRLPLGLHSVRVSRQGYVTQVHEIFIEEGRAAYLSITFEKER